MSNLDDELSRALAEHSEEGAEAEGQAAEAGSQPVAAAPATRARSANAGEEAQRKKGIGLLVVLLLMGAGALFVVFSSENEAIYSATVDQLISTPERFSGRNIKVEGDLVKGSLKHRQEPCEYRFILSKNGEEIPVRYAECIVPDTFRDVPGMDVQVTAEGKLTEEGHFEATHIMAKCPSKYEMQQKAKAGETAPHELMAAPVPSEP